MTAKLIQDVTDELNMLIGLSVTTPQTSTLTATDPRDPAETMEVQFDFLVVDQLGSALSELRLNVPSLAQAGPALLSDWASALCQRITYLLEGLGPLEFEPDAGTVLIRSNSPAQNAGKRVFYEVLLHTNSNGSFSLKRYESVKGQYGRTAVNLQFTHEVLTKLVGDLVDTIPV